MICHLVKLYFGGLCLVLYNCTSAPVGKSVVQDVRVFNGKVGENL